MLFSLDREWSLLSPLRGVCSHLPPRPRSLPSPSSLRPLYLHLSNLGCLSPTILRDSCTVPQISIQMPPAERPPDPSAKSAPPAGLLVPPAQCAGLVPWKCLFGFFLFVCLHSLADKVHGDKGPICLGSSCTDDIQTGVEPSSCLPAEWPSAGAPLPLAPFRAGLHPCDLPEHTPPRGARS